MEAVAALQPELYVTLADEITADAKPKRVQTSVDRTSKVSLSGAQCWSWSYVLMSHES